MRTQDRLAEEVRRVFKKKGEATIEVELHSGVCWYVADEKKFKDVDKAIGYINETLDADNIISVS
jgi:hypothetical protein